MQTELLEIGSWTIVDLVACKNMPDWYAGVQEYARLSTREGHRFCAGVLIVIDKLWILVNCFLFIPYNDEHCRIIMDTHPINYCFNAEHIVVASFCAQHSDCCDIPCGSRNCVNNCYRSVLFFSRTSAATHFRILEVLCKNLRDERIL